MSACKRYPTNECMLYGHNDGKAAFQGNALSGWLVITIPKVKQGLIFAKMQVRHFQTTFFLFLLDTPFS